MTTKANGKKLAMCEVCKQEFRCSPCNVGRFCSPACRVVGLRAPAFVVGHKQGRLTVLGEYIETGKIRYRVRCDCGTAKTVAKANLGKQKSCGCLHKPHGKSWIGEGKASPEYNSWQSMLQRCGNPNCHAYANYGGRGITVCDRWKTFTNFYADMGDRPLGTSLDRIDNNSGYSKENCRWATVKQQTRNTRATKLNWDIVNEMRGRYEHGESFKSIGVRFNMQAAHIRRICRGLRWAE